MYTRVREECAQLRLSNLFTFHLLLLSYMILEQYETKIYRVIISKLKETFHFSFF